MKRKMSKREKLYYLYLLDIIKELERIHTRAFIKELDEIAHSTLMAEEIMTIREDLEDQRLRFVKSKSRERYSRLKSKEVNQYQWEEKEMT